MATSDSEEDPRARRPRQHLATAIAVGCCAFALASVSSATAKPDHGKQTPNAPVSNSEGASTGSDYSRRKHDPPVSDHSNALPNAGAVPQAHDRGKAEDCCAIEPPPGNPVTTEQHSQQAPASGSSEGSPSGLRRHGRAGTLPDRGHKDSGGRPEQDSGGRSEQDSGGQPERDSVPHETLRLRTGRRAADKTAVSQVSHGTARTVNAPQPAPAPSPVTASSASLTGIPLSNTSTTTAPTVATPTQVASAPRPVVSARSRQAARPGRARGRVAGRHLIPAVSSPSSVAAAIPTAATPTRATRARRAPRASRHRPTAGRLYPLVRTITRIVGVVPLLVWILVGALLALALVLALRSRLAALRARRLEHQRRQLLEDVGLLQAALLPVTPARLGPVGTSAAYRPADGPGAGGDFYDVFALETGQLAVIVGDLSGHGRQALPHTALVRFTLRAYLEAGLSPREALQTAGAVLERQLGGSFATVVVATYQPRDRILVYACAGHPPPLVLGSQAIVPITVCSSPPLGVGMRTGTRQTVVSVPGFSRVCFHTDGITEARVGSELFGTQRLRRTLAALGPGVTASGLLDRVAEETDTRPDDMAACLLSIEGGTAAPAVLVEELELSEEEAVNDRTERFLLACGIQRSQIAELVRAARIDAKRAGAVLLEVRIAKGSPQVTLRCDNVAPLHTVRAKQRAALGASR